MLTTACGSGETSSDSTTSTTAAGSIAEPLEIDGPGTYEGEIVSGERLRRFVLHVPEGVAVPAPLVMVFHGFTSNPDRVAELSGMSEVADREGFVVVYPAALGLLPAWTVDVAGPENRDVAFARDLVDAVAGLIPIGDVYAAGMSNGGGMAGRLACDAADLVAGAAPVAAAHTSETCSPSRPVPVMAFHGTDDLIVPYRGFAPFDLPPIEEWAAEWARRNGCRPEAVIEEVADDVELRSWPGCSADVVLYTVDGGRHGWPGSDRAFSVLDSTTSIAASEIMWEFFRQSG